MLRTKNAEEWVANGEHKEIFRKREMDTYAEWIKSETMNPKTQKCLKHRDLCRNITLCTASVSTDSHSLSAHLMTGSLYNTSTWHIPRALCPHSIPVEQQSTSKHGMDGEGRNRVTEGCSSSEVSLPRDAFPVKGYVKFWWDLFCTV